MPPEAMEVRRWLEKAEHDERAARALLAESPAITDAAAFHCQQAAEKLLKAYLTFREVQVEKTHDLRALVIHCGDHDPAFLDLRDRMASLTPFAVRFRYPGPVDPSIDEVRSAIGSVIELREFVRSRIPSAMHPVV